MTIRYVNNNICMFKTLPTEVLEKQHFSFPNGSVLIQDTPGNVLHIIEAWFNIKKISHSSSSY